MAKDDEFLDGDEVAGEPAAKEGGKAKGGPFASAMVMQILKWVAIIIGLIVFIVTVVVVVINVMGIGNQANQQMTESPEYNPKPLDYEYFADIDEFRVDAADKDKHVLFVVKIFLGYDKSDKPTSQVLQEPGKKILITDAVHTWFQKQSSEYIRNVDNKDAIREQIKHEVNYIMEGKIKDIRFGKFEVLSL